MDSLPKLHALYVSALPADPIKDNYCRSVESAAYSFVSPTATKEATLLCVNSELAKQLGFSNQQLTSKKFAQLMTGNHVPEDCQPYAMNYGGHQFGQWAGQLGDGRAINLGQYKIKPSLYTLQLKGAGKTPYSRRADGMAVLRSSIREYLCSEAMFHLGIPTTRALSLSLTGEQVIRDKLYDGNSQLEPCAIVSRISPSFLRFGSVQLPAMRGDFTLLKETIDFSITQDYPQLLGKQKNIDERTYLRWFEEITKRTAKLIVEWMRVGFVHGVLNTDNMSLIGETIDYGPYGWIDNFDLNWTPNTSDSYEKRYRFGQQPYIGQWNLFQLANAIYPIVQEEEALKSILNSYNEIYLENWLLMMSKKLGLKKDFTNDKTTSKNFFTQLEACLAIVDTDMTLFYRRLAEFSSKQSLADLSAIKTHFSECYYQLDQINDEYLTQLSTWLGKYTNILRQDGIDDAPRKQAMNTINPCYILRNFQVQRAINAAESGDYSIVDELATLIKQPYTPQEKYQKYAEKRPDWAKQMFGCSALSCSS